MHTNMQILQSGLSTAVSATWLHTLARYPDIDKPCGIWTFSMNSLLALENLY